VIAVKDNQPKLLAAIQKPFFDHLEGDLKDLKPQSHETHEDGHGRIDDRYYDVAEVASVRRIMRLDLLFPRFSPRIPLEDFGQGAYLSLGNP
jgi:hypothetical protein